MNIQQFVNTKTDYTSEDMEIINGVAANIDYYRQLSSHDVFVDIFASDDSVGIVYAHSRPDTTSLYEKNIEGEIVQPVNEPIVFYTRKTGLKIRDAKGFSQENKWVLQHTIPIKNRERIIAVLIEESDASKELMDARKIKEMSNQSDKFAMGIKSQSAAADEVMDKYAIVQEMHHRIKNNLQIISSILSMQSRRCTYSETKEVLEDNISRINNIARMHEAIMKNPQGEMNLCNHLSDIADNMIAYAGCKEKRISIQVTGDEILVDQNQLMTISMVVSELLTNSISHGFKDNSEGLIEINVIKGIEYATVMVKDNGTGITAHDKNNTESLSGLGSKIVEVLVTNNLKGSYNLESTSTGTNAYFDFMLNSQAT